MRNIKFTTNEHYHLFNRGTDKRPIFMSREDLARFFQSMTEFNVVMPIGSIYENSFQKNNNKLGSLASKSNKKLINFICYCLNPNHYHFIIEQLVDRGIEKFMQKLGTGYTKYFNNKYCRNGSLFQGTFKATRIDSNEYLLHLSAYINLNNKIHALGSLASKLSKSSWEEYVGNNSKNFCSKNIILKQFNSKEEYEKFAEEALIVIQENKEAKKLLLE